MKKPTPQDYILQRAQYWRTTEKALLAAQGLDKAKAAMDHQTAKRRLREALTYADRVPTTPPTYTACQPNKPAL